MSSPSVNADIGILAQNQPNNNTNNNHDDASASSTSGEEPEFTSRGDVYECIEYGTDHCGNCCYADIADGSTTPPALPSIIGLRISGVGNVPLPITEYHGNEIKRRATKQEKEEGAEVYYEIEAGKIKIQSPQWDESLKKVIETVAYKLGVFPNYLTAKLDGLIYMEKGGCIERRRRDNNEDTTTLGSLVIQLPSKFTGGEMTIYNAVEEEDEDYEEESFKFTLGAGAEATYSCHFACHFSDCEYEMAKLRSGSRLLLRYSLHYEQVDENEMIPTASLINESTSQFKRSLNGLPPADRMVLIPLEEEYDVLSLVNCGINALSRKHRQKAEALKAAGADWELLIVNAKLVHNCGHRVDCNKTSIIEVFDENGIRVTSEMSWLNDVVDFDSFVHDDGMLLAFEFEDECVSNWGDCKSAVGSYDSEQTYRATFLLSYDPAFETELKCLGGFGGVAEVCQKIVDTRDYDLLDRVLAVVEARSKCKVDVHSCQILLQMLLKSRKNLISRATLVNKIISGLSTSEEPDELLYDTIIDAVDKLGYKKLGEGIGVLFGDIVRKRDKDISVFLRRMEFALKLRTRTEDGSSNYLEGAVNDLSRYANTRLIRDSTAVVNTIMNMIATYNDTDLSNIVEACLNFFHRNSTLDSYTSLDVLMNRMHLLQQLLATNKFGSLQSSLVEFSADFARRAENLPALTSKARLEGEGKGRFLQATSFLIEYGTQIDWNKFGKHILRTMDLFSAFIDAVMSVSGQGLLLDVLNKCLVQYSIVSPDTFIRSWTVQNSNEEQILPTPSLHVQKVLELCPNIVQMVDNDKRLPLHHAAASSTASFEVTMELFEAYKHAASVRDPITGLFPFQLAASNGNYKASFSLLLANPSLVSSGTYVSDRKRKRSSSA